MQASTETMIPLTVSSDIPDPIMKKLMFKGSFDQEAYSFIIGRGYISPPEDPEDRHWLKDELAHVKDEHIVGKPIYREHNYSMPIGSVFSYHIDHEAGEVWIGAMLHNSGDNRKKVVEAVRSGKMSGLSLGLLISNKKTNARSNKSCFEFSLCKEGRVPGCETVVVYSKNPQFEEMETESANPPSQAAQPEVPTPDAESYSQPTLTVQDADSMFNEIFNDNTSGKEEETKSEKPDDAPIASAVPRPRDIAIEVLNETAQQNQEKASRANQATSRPVNHADLMKAIPPELREGYLAQCRRVEDLQHMVRNLQEKQHQHTQEYLKSRVDVFNKHRQLFYDLGIADSSKGIKDEVLQKYWRVMADPENHALASISDKLVEAVRSEREQHEALRKENSALKEKTLRYKKSVEQKLNEMEQWGNQNSRKRSRPTPPPPSIAAYSLGGNRCIGLDAFFKQAMEEPTPMSTDEKPQDSIEPHNKKVKDEKFDNEAIVAVRQSLQTHPNFRTGGNDYVFQDMKTLGTNPLLLSHAPRVSQKFMSDQYTTDGAFNPNVKSHVRDAFQTLFSGYDNSNFEPH